MEKRFTVDQKTLLNVLSSMQPICSKRTALEATSSILFQVGNKELILKSTDLEISLQATCPLIESSFDEEPQLFLAPGRRIFDIVKELNSSISCSLSKNQLSLQSGAVSLSLNIKDAEEFPPFPEKIENIMHLNAPLLLKMIESVVFLIPQNNANAALNGLLLEIKDQTLKMTTTDGHCLAQVDSEDVQYTENKSWLLPRRAVYELKKILETSEDQTIFLGTCLNQLVLSGELFNFFTKLLADQFPHYQSILDKTLFKPAQIDRSMFLKTLRRSVCILSGQFVATKFTFKDELLKVSIHNKEVGSLDEQILLKNKIEYQMDIRFYSPYLLSGLQSFNKDTITFYLKNSMSPIIFELSSDNYKMTYLVMPVSPSN